MPAAKHTEAKKPNRTDAEPRHNEKAFSPKATASTQGTTYDFEQAKQHSKKSEAPTKSAAKPAVGPFISRLKPP